MLNDFKRHIKSKFPEILERPLYVAVSGGVDSIVLLHLLNDLDLSPTVLHCNFQLRAEASEMDESLVIDECQKLGLECYVKHFDTKLYMAEKGVNVQMAARDLRYDWFESVVTKVNGLLLTAHHEGDIVETFMMNLARGSGIQGLTSIPLKRDYIRRPMSIFSKSSILDYAETHKLNWREDSSNSESTYLRNQLRLEVLPQLDSWYTGFSKNVINSVGHLNRANSFIKAALREFKALKLENKKDHWKIDLSTFSKEEGILLELLLLEFEFPSDAIEKIVESISSDQSRQGVRFESDAFELIIGRDCLEIFKIGIQEYSVDKIVVKSLNGACQLHGRNLDLSLITIKEVSSIKSALGDYLDATELTTPLILRKVEPGDKMKPLGMNGSKLLSDIMIDEKWSASKKRAAIVLESDQKVIWLSDFRISEDFKLKASTTSVLKLNLH